MKQDALCDGEQINLTPPPKKKESIGVREMAQQVNTSCANLMTHIQSSVPMSDTGVVACACNPNTGDAGSQTSVLVGQ